MPFLYDSGTCPIDTIFRIMILFSFIKIKFVVFRWRKTEDNRSILLEKQDIRYKRIKFLKAMIQYRAENWNIIYTDETYIHSSHTQSHRWSDQSGKELKKPISKGKRLVIVHAGGERGFIPNGLLIFKSGERCLYYIEIVVFYNFRLGCFHFFLLYPNL